MAPVGHSGAAGVGTRTHVRASPASHTASWPGRRWLGRRVTSQPLMREAPGPHPAGGRVCCSGLRAHAAPADLTGRELGDGWPLHLAAAFSLRPPDLKGTGFITTETLPRVSAPCFRLVEFKTNYGTSPGGNCEHRASPLLRPPPPRPFCRTVHLWPAAPPQATRLPTLWRQRALGTPRPAAPSPSTPALQETLQQERDIFFF